MISCILPPLLIRSAPSNVSEDLDELHDKLWGQADLFHQVFRAVDLTKDFVELQSNLHRINPSRNSKSYVAKEVLETKMNFLRSRTATRPLTVTTDSLVPKVVLQASEDLVPADNVKINSKKNIKQQRDDKGKDIDDESAKGDVHDKDTKGDENDQHSESDDVDEDVRSYIDEDAAVLSHGSNPVLPCTIRYMDLTCLGLQHFDRVPEVLLIRDEWDAVIDIFNKRPSGKRGSAVWTGQPGIGKRHYGPSIGGLQLITLLNEGKTALLYYILVICLIQAQSIIFQDTNGAVYTINDKVHKQMGDTVIGLRGDQDLASREDEVWVYG